MLPVLRTGPYDYGVGDRSTEVNVAMSEAKDPVLSAGPSSVLRADPDPAVAIHPDDRQGESQNRE